MTITVRFFASLREELGQAETKINFQSDLTVTKVWEQATNRHPVPENMLSAVNQEYTDFSQPVQDGDEVAFFPPVTGG